MRRRLSNGLSTREKPEWLAADPVARDKDATPAAGVDVETQRYDFHGLFSVRASHRGLRDLLERELSMFRKDGSAADLTIEEGEPDPVDDRMGLDYAFGEEVLVAQTESGRIQISDGFLRAEPRVSGDVLLSQYVESYMQHTIPGRGASIVHASAVSRDGVGLLFPAWRHTGKTAVALELVNHGYSFMADDWSIVTSAGEILAYPRWLRLFQYNFELHPFLARNLPAKFGGRRLRRSLVLRRFADSLRATNPMTARVRREIEDRYYPYAQVPVSVAIPNARTARKARLEKACLLTTSARDPWSVREIPASLLAQRMAATANYERTSIAEHGLAEVYIGRRPEPRDIYADSIRVLQSALQNAVCLEMRIPTPLGKISHETIEAQLRRF